MNSHLRSVAVKKQLVFILLLSSVCHGQQLTREAAAKILNSERFGLITFYISNSSGSCADPKQAQEEWPALLQAGWIRLQQTADQWGKTCKAHITPEGKKFLQS